MYEVNVERLSEAELERRGVSSWAVWEKEVSRFSWSYDSNEECFLLEGKARVTPDGGDPVEFEAGDFVTFPEGMSCIWEIFEDVKKRYRFF